MQDGEVAHSEPQMTSDPTTTLPTSCPCKLPSWSGSPGEVGRGGEKLLADQRVIAGGDEKGSWAGSAVPAI